MFRPITGTTTLVLGCLGALWDLGRQVQIGLIWLLVIMLGTLTVVAAAAKMVIQTRRSARDDLPRPVYVDAALNGSTTLVMRPSRQFGVNMLFTIYYEERLGIGASEIFERSIGVGQVVNVQENGLIQVRLLREVSEQSEPWDCVRKRETTILSDIVINAAGIEVRFDERY